MQFFDRLVNLVTGLGQGKDKASGNIFGLRLVTDPELSAMHRSDWLSRKIVDIIPNDMTREWRDWQAKPDQIEAIEAYEALPLISVQPKVNAALRKARLYGGSVIFMGMKDGRHEEELVIDKVGKDELLYLHVLNRCDVTVGELILDVTSPYFGEPSYYEVAASNGQQAKVHPSRMIRFIGAQILDERNDASQGWGDSVLQIAYDAIQNAGSSQAHIASLIPELKTDIIYVPGLSKHLQNPVTTKQLTERFSYANTIKSMFSMTLLEGNGGTGEGAVGEKWEQKQISFAQMPELMQQYLQIAAGAADIPVTRLLGQSPSGMNATGDGDIRNYYDNVSARQRTELTPRLNRLDEVLIRSATGSRDKDIHYTWAPLWGLSEKERAEVFKTTAEAARTIIGTGGASPSIIPIEAMSDALVNRLIEDGVLPGLEAAIGEYGKLSEQEDDPVDAEAALGVTAAPQVVADAEPKSLYVRRDVLNASDLIAWAKTQGFDTTLPGSDMHVTITYSRSPVDWMRMGENWSGDEKGRLTINAGGPRMMEQFGKAIVLLFASSTLSWRHESMVQGGASWDHDEYQPHITITYDAPEGFDLATIEPYKGEIILGPEIFEPIKDDWAERIAEE